MNASLFSPFFSPTLQDKSEAAFCIALSDGLTGCASPFSLAALFGQDALLGPEPPKTRHEAADFFKLPAPVYLCDEVTSTFAVAHALAREDLLPEWGAVLAARQTAGRGQLRRRWQSPPGNLYVTFRLPDVPVFHTDAAALTVGLLAAASFSDMGMPLLLKWPNDLLNRQQAKVAGILLEERGSVVLAGMGVNLRVLPDEQVLRRDRATSAGLLTDAAENSCPHAPFVVWRALVNKIVSAYGQKILQSAAESLPTALEPFLAWKGEAVGIVDTSGDIAHGRLLGVGPAGGLRIGARDGSVREVFSGSLTRI